MGLYDVDKVLVANGTINPRISNAVKAQQKYLSEHERRTMQDFELNGRRYAKTKKIIEKNIIFFSMTFLEMAALFNFMFLMEMLIFFYKHQQKADHKESTGNPDHSDSIAYGQISTNAGTQGKHKDDSKIIHRLF